jgi:hypothetical protein
VLLLDCWRWRKEGDRLIEIAAERRVEDDPEFSIYSFGLWLMLICSERKILLAGCWWLICSKRKVLLAGG